MKILKKILYFLIAIVCIAAAIGISYIGGYIIRWFVWLICFIWEIFRGKNAVTIWIDNHDTIVHIICSFLTLPSMALIAFSESGSTNSTTAGNYKNASNFSYDDEVKEMNRNNFYFVDCSGSYRRWGDSFIDHKGNWCSWGSGFYDYDDNYIRWGGTYKDCSGAYRRWGDTFIDCAGNHIHIP